MIETGIWADATLPSIEWHFLLTPAEISSLDTYYEQKDEREESDEQAKFDEPGNDELSDKKEEEESNDEEELSPEEIEIPNGTEEQNTTVEHQERKPFAGRTDIPVVYSRRGLGSGLEASIPGEILTASQVKALLSMRPRVEYLNLRSR